MSNLLSPAARLGQLIEDWRLVEVVRKARGRVYDDDDEYSDGFDQGEASAFAAAAQQLADLLPAVQALEQEQLEVCVCAAVRLIDGRVIRAHRHHEALRIAGEYGVRDAHRPEQGFVTTKNRFVGRREAMALQRAAGKLSACYRGPLRGEILFSEDLYMGDYDAILLAEPPQG